MEEEQMTHGEKFFAETTDLFLSAEELYRDMQSGKIGLKDGRRLLKELDAGQKALETRL